MIEVDTAVEKIWTAFRGLSPADQQAILVKLIRNDRLRHDLMDLALIEERKDEPARPFREYVKETG